MMTMLRTGGHADVTEDTGDQVGGAGARGVAHVGHGGDGPESGAHAEGGQGEHLSEGGGVW